MSAGWQQADAHPPEGTDVLVWTGMEFLVGFYVVSKSYTGWTTGWETVGGYDVGYSVLGAKFWQPLPTPPVER